MSDPALPRALSTVWWDGTANLYFTRIYNERQEV